MWRLYLRALRGPGARSTSRSKASSPSVRSATSSIAACDPGIMGLQVQTANGGLILVWAIQKSKVSRSGCTRTPGPTRSRPPIMAYIELASASSLAKPTTQTLQRPLTTSPRNCDQCPHLIADHGVGAARHHPCHVRRRRRPSRSTRAGPPCAPRPPRLASAGRTTGSSTRRPARSSSPSGGSSPSVQVSPMRASPESRAAGAAPRRCRSRRASAPGRRPPRTASRAPATTSRRVKSTIRGGHRLEHLAQRRDAYVALPEALPPRPSPGRRPRRRRPRAARGSGRAARRYRRRGCAAGRARPSPAPSADRRTRRRPGVFLDAPRVAAVGDGDRTCHARLIVAKRRARQLLL